MQSSAGSVTASWVACDVIQSPVGPLFVAATEAGVCALAYDHEPALERLERRTGAPVRPYREPLLDVQRELEEYFAAERTRFEVALDLRWLPPFSRRVLERTAAIPFGEVRTYAEVARDIDSPRAARAVGQALNRNPIAIIVPCHRVVGSSGELTGYGGGLGRKMSLLALEEVRWPGASSPNVSSN